MILDHITVSVANFERSKDFYERALKPLGITVAAQFDGFAGMGKNGRPQFWFAAGTVGAHKTHIAFVAQTRAEVDAFYAAAIAAGGRDNGKPGVRTLYHPTYYGAFVFDPDGYNVEAVCHAAP
ncbi:MAG: VOC family protein [Proteobacteria bacterium]|jgi:catechol 2,3-dioxygenase-like lactoylglutathione lyase family enzyme|nr:VOC family protein [Pseudomonadota bacterium]